jgi:hypothetical protein
MPIPAELVDQLVIVLAVCYAGDCADGERALAPLRAFGRPLGSVGGTV